MCRVDGEQIVDKPGEAVDVMGAQENANDQDAGTDEAQPSPVLPVVPSSSSSSSPYRTQAAEFDTFLQRYSARMATRPCVHFWSALVVSLTIGVIGLTVGDFTVAVDNAGWYSRGTQIANREQQYRLVNYYREELFNDKDGTFWLGLETQSQAFQRDDDDEVPDDRRLWETLESDREVGQADKAISSAWDIGTWGSQLHTGWNFFSRQPNAQGNHDARLALPQNPLDSATRDWVVRRLQEAQLSDNNLAGCDVTWYNSSRLFDESRLWPVYKGKQAEVSLWDGPALQEMCEQEAVTQQVLEENGWCFGCNEDNRCLLPYSPVLLARLTVPNGLTLSCADLAETWANNHLAQMEQDAIPCVAAIKTDYNPDRDGAELPPGACPAFFFPSMLDEDYGLGEVPSTMVKVASAIFATGPEHVDDMYDAVDSFGYGSVYMNTYYDTQQEDFVIIATDAQVLIDMALAVGSALITYLAMIIHTRSPFLASIGLLQIVLSFPLAFFFYTFVARLTFFPFLNFIGLFVIFALGADDVFVAVDKWKNARLRRPDAPVQEIAAQAFPDAAGAMLLTTMTTAVAFFGTAVCPVAPILCFAVFVGLLVAADYVLCLLLVFPALVIYDRRLKSERPTGCCCHCGVRTCCCCCFKGRHSNNEEENPGDNHDAENTASGTREVQPKPSLIHRILDRYYSFLHRFRWILLVVCAGALVVSAIKAAQIRLPASADVRLFDEDDNQYEANYIQRQNVLFDAVERQVGSSAYVIWGVIPADTGNHNNPESWTKLVLDPNFDPSNEEAQMSLLEYCDDFFGQEFASKIRTDYECPMTRLSAWLADQAASETKESIYEEHCAEASGLLIPQANFDECAYAWSQEYLVDSMLAKNKKITIITLPFSSRVRFDSPQDKLEDEWNLIESWMIQKKGPASAGKAYFTSEDFWWYDTNEQMLDTAFKSAAIAMGAAAAVILFSSRSFVLTLFATVTVGYVLTSVTALLVAAGWTLGFLESILFAILIGISCDFVIHFSHAYASLQGHAPRNERTRFALISMGPSVLAAAFTTFAAALVMLGTVVTFFEKFAVILFLTIAQSTIGAFLVFNVMVDCVGPSDPTNLVDKMLLRCFRYWGKEYHVQGLEETQHFRTKEFNSLDG